MSRWACPRPPCPACWFSIKESKSFGTSLRWLFETGQGANRQLIAYREVRQPDLAAGAFAVRRRRACWPSGPGAHCWAWPSRPASCRPRAASTCEPGSHAGAYWRRVAPAVAVDAALLTAYFAGRLAGLAAVTHRFPDPRPGQARAAGSATSPR